LLSAPIKLSSPATHEFWEIPVLFEDEHLLALAKPWGLPTTADPHDPDRPNLMALLHAGIAAGKPWAVQRQLAYVRNAHRLDAETSGVLLLARSKPVLTALANRFNTETPNETCLVVAQGTPAQARFEVSAPIGAHPARPGAMRVSRGQGKKARTLFEVAEWFRGCALLRCQPLTQRPHQVRVHLQWARLPVAGDTLYGGRALLLSRLKPHYRLKGDREERPLLGEARVHVERIELPHPVTGQPLVIACPWPRELMVALKYLRRYAAAEPPRPEEPPPDPPADLDDPDAPDRHEPPR